MPGVIGVALPAVRPRPNWPGAQPRPQTEQHDGQQAAAKGRDGPVPMTESPNQEAARAVVERQLGVRLDFAETDGRRVDFLLTDPDGFSAELEVTTLTDQKLKEAVAAHRDKSREYEPRDTLKRCWDVIADERTARYSELLARLESAVRMPRTRKLRHSGRCAAPLEKGGLERPGSCTVRR